MEIVMNSKSQQKKTAALLTATLLGFTPSALVVPASAGQQEAYTIPPRNRHHLPMPNTVRQTYVNYDAKNPDTRFPPIRQVRPPQGAPNVLIVRIDDAGFLEYTDYHVGKIVDALEKLEILDNTLIFYICGDNGASAEGGINGYFNEMSYFNGLQALEMPEYLLERLDELGGPKSYNHYAVGWALAMNTPYQWTKQVASHWGGTRNGTVVHWPKRFRAGGELRHQFTHVIDVAPTVLEAVGLPHPESVNGIRQDALEGVSMLYSFDDSAAAERHDTQYFEMFGNRRPGWMCCCEPDSIP
jgi:hypothetical protein